jgi:NADP-dependent 3-hydroxy acid dehydrogenase YdfG
MPQRLEARVIEKRVAIVTGASRGIGRAIAERLAKDGRHVVLVARSAEGLAATDAAIKAAGGSCEVRPCDIANSADVQQLVDGVAETHGRLDILVNNAGITRDTLLLRMTDEQWDEVLNVNLRSVFVACRAALRPMMRGKFGRIVSRKFISICGREFKCEWSGIDIITIIINFIVLTIFFPIVIVIWGIVLIREQFRWIKRKFLRIKIGK